MVASHPRAGYTGNEPGIRHGIYQRQICWFGRADDTVARRPGDERGRVEGEVRRVIERHALLPESGRVVVAVSGGADSLCLLGALDALCGQDKIWPHVELVVAHLDHGMRGQQAEADA